MRRLLNSTPPTLYVVCSSACLFRSRMCEANFFQRFLDLSSRPNESARTS